MTDKQIIIDGVDVKDCKRRIGKENYCRYYKRPCAENNYNCIWKKYLRKEQECEKLNKIINEAKNSKLDLKSFLVCEAVQNEYEQQLELKKEECNELKELNTRLDRQREAYWKGYQKLDKALTEIKELAEVQQSWNEVNRQFSETESEDDIFAYNWSALKQILQKISEVLDENI